jgi:hypothetical protein
MYDVLEVDISIVKGRYPNAGIRCDYCLNPFQGQMFYVSHEGRFLTGYPLHNLDCCEQIILSRFRYNTLKINTYTYASIEEFRGEERTE